MQIAQLKAVNAARTARKAAVLITDFADGTSQVVVEGDAVDYALKDAVEKAFRTGSSGRVQVDGKDLFFNVHVPPPRIVVIGAVHISQALAGLAQIAGFDIRIIDPRTAFATEERFSGIDLVADWPEDVLKDKPLDAYSALVAVTHDPKIDDYPLIQALQTGCFYVGALGSRKTHLKRVERFQAAGLGEGQISRIAAPIGLDIGASSPPEIAVAILAQIIQAFRRRSLSLSERAS
jgi:xanthine dehydrogenase accessory factor